MRGEKREARHKEGKGGETGDSGGRRECEGVEEKERRKE